MIGEFVRTRDKLEKSRTRIDVPCLFILIPHITLPLLSSDDRSLYVCLSAKADKGYHLPLTDTKCDHPNIYAVKAGSQIRVYVDDDPKGSVFPLRVWYSDVVVYATIRTEILEELPQVCAVSPMFPALETTARGMHPPWLRDPPGRLFLDTLKLCVGNV